MGEAVSYALAVLEAMGDASILMKVVVFLVVQALVYLILSNSSDLFSRKKMMNRSFSFKPARMASIRRILDAFSDLPQGGESSPTVSSAGEARDGTPGMSEHQGSHLLLD